MNSRLWLAIAVGIGVLAVLAACDQQKIEKLEEGVSGEREVRAQFGEPASIYVESDGSRTFEYPRQPNGQANYLITIAPDGKMSSLRQVLTPDNFAKVTPGMSKEQLRRMLGRPAKTQRYALKHEEDWDWHYRVGQQALLFTATFDDDGKLIRSGSMDDPRETQRGG